MLTELDHGWTQGEFLNFHDEGIVVYKTNGKKGTTKIFNVYSRTNHSPLGVVRWFSNWRQYCYFCGDFIMDSRCLREVAEFCDTKTTEYKERQGWRVAKPPVRSKLLPRDYQLKENRHDGLPTIS
jgi:hypothetical protein